MPVLAVASGIAAGTLAALPLTIGFFKDELFFGAAAERGWFVQGMAVVAAALTFAYIGRFWLGLFTGAQGTRPQAIPALLTAPVVVLAALAVIGGILVDPFAELANDAATVTHAAPVDVSPAYHLEASAENVMAILAWAIGGLILAVPKVRDPAVRALGRAGEVIGPRRAYGVVLRTLNRVSDAVHDLEVRDLRNSLAAVLVPSGIAVALGFALTPTEGVYQVGSVKAAELPIIGLLALSVVAAFTAARDTGRLRPVLALSVLGFALAGVYAVVGAPDVALVAVVVETIFTLVFVGVFARLPPTRARAEAATRRRGRARNALAGVIAGLGAFATIWAALSRTAPDTGDAAGLITRTPEAHGGDVVTVTLADFRGLDTMVEITVLAVAIVGVAGLLRRGRTW
jgi:multicomponent Na+:H+ antiporter subunit A